MSQQSIRDIRTEYSKHNLDEQHVAADPISQFGLWFAEAQRAEIPEINAMILSTTDANSQSKCRVVLLKEFSSKGFTFFTNYQSDKGTQITANPKVCLLFFWKELERQIQILGTAHKIPKEESKDYFHSRPRESQIGACTSDQSKKIESRSELEDRFKQLSIKYENREVEYPEHWGGFLVEPIEMEFWQGRPGRLHDRIVYQKKNDIWEIFRRQP